MYQTPTLRPRTSSLMIIHIFHAHSHLSLHVPLEREIYQEGFCKKKGKQDYSSTKRQAATRAMATDLFAITVDADDYATTAANDVHRVITTCTNGGEVVEEEKDDDEEDDNEDEKDDDEKEKEENQSRTFQSEENFQLQRKNYSAKIYGYHHPSRRLKLFEEFQLDVFGFDAGLDVDSKDIEKYGNGDGKEEKEEEGDVEGKIQLSKSQIQFLGQVIGELYFEEEFEKLVEFCGRVRRRCCFCGGQKGLEERLSRWEGRCLERLSRWEGRCLERLGREGEGGGGGGGERGGSIVLL